MLAAPAGYCIVLCSYKSIEASVFDIGSPEDSTTYEMESITVKQEQGGTWFLDK